MTYAIVLSILGYTSHLFGIVLQPGHGLQCSNDFVTYAIVLSILANTVLVCLALSGNQIKQGIVLQVLLWVSLWQSAAA